MKVISGGQKGVDRIGLDAARNSGIQTGGFAPKNWWTEDGPDPSLKDYGLIEIAGHGYYPRTFHNVLQATGTVLFGDMNSSGSKLTIEICVSQKKPYICNPTANSLRDWIFANNIEVLNVAGNRASKLTTDKMKAIYNTLRLAFEYWKNPDMVIFI